MFYPCIPYSHREHRLFWRRFLSARMPRRHRHTQPPSPGSYLGEPLLVDMVHHHHLVIKRSARPSWAAGGGKGGVLGGSSYLHLCKQPLLLESSLVPPPNSWLQVVKTHPSGAISLGPALSAASQPLGCGLGKLNPGGQKKVTWKSRTERLFHHPLGFEERTHLSLPLEPTVSCHRCHLCSSPTNKKPNQTLWWARQP